MSKKNKNLSRILSLLLLLTSLVPLNQPVLAAATLPPVDMFQLPWEQGQAWVAIDGIDNGTDRHAGSPHNYLYGGAIDFAPHNNMIPGENTANFWVTAVADGTIVETSKCHLKIAHADGWVSEYQHLANIQVKLGDVVARNQHLAVIANATTQPVCPGSEPPDIPHLHFTLRPTMIGVSFAGWEVKYSSFWNATTFKKGSQTLGLYKPLLNVFDTQPTPTPSVPPTATSDGQTTPTPGDPPTSTTTAPVGPYVSTSVSVPNVNLGETALVTVSLNNVPSEGYTSTEFTCTYNPILVAASNTVIADLFGADSVSALSNSQNGFILAIAGSKDNKATTSGVAFTFDVKGLDVGQTALECTARISNGNNVLTPLPSIGTSLSVLGVLPTPTFTETPSPIVSSTPVVLPSSTPTAYTSDWLTFTNLTFGFEFKYPPQGLIAAGGDDNDTRIDNLPIAPGTNLHEKYLEMIVGGIYDPCQSPLATQSMLQTSETVIINGISFLRQTGADAGAGNFYDWVAYSTPKDNFCVSLDFVLHSHNPGVYSTPPPLFDYAAETAVFEQIVSTYAWLANSPTVTPTFTEAPIESPTPTFTSTPFASPTPSGGNGSITGQVTASKPVVVTVFDASTVLVATMETSPDGSFQFEVAPGDYTVVASAPGFLSAQANVPALNAGVTRILPAITLLAGDIDGNNVIDQFDAMTIGMSYNTATPAAADLNNDGIINVIDLERLAQNYRKTGPVVWQ